ncbi:MAG: filamentous hemagglutinin N-terminal domain-containing protein, partial [Psychrobacter sp.]|nr:filamentous hemagglutinin N-terminal domain-containing protein [Psychrobacter sp.]
MEKKNTKAKLTAQISLALMAGMFSIVPVVYGAPVVDTTQNNTAAVTTAGLTTNIVGEKTNNVVHWQDFSVAKGEKVQFDADNPAAARNYMNLVTGANQSRIDGAIQGGNDIYIINQNGVIFGKSASVDVGSLYVSTTSAIDSAKIDAFTTSGTNPLTDTAASAAADIVNMGKVTADSVYVEGGNIKFMNTEDITASQVTANAQGTVRFDHKSGVDTSNFTANTGTRNDYTLISSLSEINDLSGRYALSGDITLSIDVLQTAIGTNSSTPFTGAFDGNYYVISNYKSKSGQSYAGLFGYTQGATIENIGLTNAYVMGVGAVGSLIGEANHTTINNVYNKAGTGIWGTGGSADVIAGGIVGRAINQTIITNAYNTAPVHGSKPSYKAGGIVGSLDNSSLVNVYNTGSIYKDATNALNEAGIAYTADSNSSITNAYTTTTGLLPSGNSPDKTNTYVIDNTSKTITADSNNASVNKSATQKDNYKFWDNDEGKDEWAIYDDLPILRSFLRANGTVSVNYTYTRDSKTVTHNSVDDTVWTYNGKTTTINATASAGGTVSKDIRNKGTYNLFTSTQDGYDYVGNAIIVKPYQIKTGIKQDTKIKKVYDGTADASSALTNLFQGTSGGILEDDINDITMNFAATNEPKFTKDGSESPDAGVGKTVTATGTVSLTGDTYGNYELVDINDATNVGTVTDGVNSLTFTGTSNNGVIEQRELRIELATPTGIDREYNGTTTVYDEDQTATANYTPEKQIQLAATQGTNGGLANGETLDNLGLSYDTNAYYVDLNADNKTYSRTKNAGSHAVEYGKIKLNSANYKLVDATDTSKVIYSAAVTGLDGTGVNTTNGGALYGSGTINKKSLSSKDFSWYKDGIAQTATKEYDGSTGYTAPVGNVVKNAALAALPASEDLTFTVQSADFVTSSEGSLDANNHRTAATTKNAGTAQGVLYTVSITGEDAVNYTLDGAVINTTGTNTVIGAGTITPRTLNLIVNANADMDKVYDGNAYVTGATENNPAYLTDAVLSGATGFLKYQDTDADHHFLSNDTNAQIKVIGKYQATGNDYGEAKNVNYDAANNTALAKDIVYEAAVMEGDAESSNYKFAIINTGNTVVEATNTDATKADFKGTDAQGIINQREIDKIEFADVDKTYDGSSAVTNTTNNGNDVTFKTNDRITIKDLQLNGVSALSAAGETVGDVLDVDANGQIAEGTDNALISGVYGEGTDWQANEHAGTKVVHYTISDGLWKNHNYKLTADAKFEGKGTINKLAIAPDDIKLERNNTVITKVYNGDDDVATVADTVGNVNRSVTDYLTERQAYVSKDGHELDIAVQVDGANYETSHHKNVSGSMDLTVNYTVSLVNAADYTIKDTDGHSVTQITRDEDANGNKITGTISARPITVTTADIVNNDAANGGLTKVYDATANVNGSGESLVSGINSQILSADQTDGVANATTGAYNNKHVNSNDTANLDANGLKPVTYDLQLAKNDYGDYKFVDANGSDISQ